MSLRSKIIRLAHEKKELRPHLVPLLKESAWGPSWDEASNREYPISSGPLELQVRVRVYGGQWTNPYWDGDTEKGAAQRLLTNLVRSGKVRMRGKFGSLRLQFSKESKYNPQQSMFTFYINVYGEIPPEMEEEVMYAVESDLIDPRRGLLAAYAERYEPFMNLLTGMHEGEWIRDRDVQVDIL